MIRVLGSFLRTVTKAIGDALENLVFQTMAPDVYPPRLDHWEPLNQYSNQVPYTRTRPRPQICNNCSKYIGARYKNELLVCQEYPLGNTENQCPSKVTIQINNS